MNRRKERLEKAIEEQVSVILLREIRDTRIGFCTIRSVSCSKDFRYATIFVSFMGATNTQEQGMMGLKSATNHIQSLLAHKLNMKFAPIIQFKLDHTIEQGVNLVHRIDEIIEKDHKEESKEP